MPSTREIRRRIKSIKSTSQITKAMEMVAASKMRRAQERVLASRPYAHHMREILIDVAGKAVTGEVLHPLLERRETGAVGVIFISGERGLCGGFNANVLRRVAGFIGEIGGPTTLITVGRKGRDHMVRAGYQLSAEYSGLGGAPKSVDSNPIARTVIEDYTAGKLKIVFLVYTQFVSTMTQRPVVQQLLPVEPEKLQEEGPGAADYIYEPSPMGVMAELLPRFVEVQVYQAILESVASEESARMVAMRNATENAKELIESLTLTYNKARQTAITRELVDITTSMQAMRT
ncbi:MAG: ATP synthase F1 subunit gamma [Chloroflexota bacterium]|nr:ATP synthase F1 subunit gamma [Chloroflexota bacterium]